jgi:AcrR family transcriptional regulator
LNVTRRLVADDGLAQMTIQRVAQELGVTKQAVLYWFPSRNILLQELLFEGVDAESDALVRTVEGVTGAATVVACFVRGSFTYYRSTLPTFRLMYLAGQLERDAKELVDPELAARRLYPVTSKIYDVLQQRFESDPAFPPEVNARNFAVSLHMAVVGHACVCGLMDAVDDDFRQSFDDMLEAFIGVLTAGLRG